MKIKQLYKKNPKNEQRSKRSEKKKTFKDLLEMDKIPETKGEIEEGRENRRNEKWNEP